MKKLFYRMTMALFVAGVVGCSATAPVEKEGASAPAVRSTVDQLEGRGMVRDDATRGKALDEDSLLSRTTIYFAFDSSEIAPEFRELLRAHGKYLASHPEIRITIEGHTDERGSREYNLALGERRAYAVRQLLMLQGVAPNQLEVISFGEERPVAYEHDESAWRLNRRAVLRYPGR